MAHNSQPISRNALWAVAQTVISACVLFFLYRFLLHELGATKLGLWSLILASTSLARLGELGFSTATLRFVGKYMGANKPQDAAETLETALLTISLPFLLLTILVTPLIGVVLPWFVPAQHMAEATIIVPWAMLALWLGVTGGLVQSAIDGCGRMDQRNIVLILGSLLYLTLAMLLTPKLGLKGVAIAQTAQAGASLLIMWGLAKLHMGSLPWLPRRWSKHRFTEIAGFALTMQAGSVAGMFVEPVAKAMISRFAGLEFLAYFDMANQVVTRARSVLVSGFQAITPLFASSSDRSMHRQLFLQSQKKVIDLGIPFLALVMVGFPILSEVWIGHSEPVFIAIGQILGATWMLVTLTMPAYFLLTGTGHGRPVAAAQLATLAGTFALGWLGGRVQTQFGPILGASAALILSNIYLYNYAVKHLFLKTDGSTMPSWITERMLKDGLFYFVLVGTNILAVKYLGSRWEYFFILAILIASMAGFAYKNGMLKKMND